MHKANGIKIIIFVSSLLHSVSCPKPKDLNAHFEYDRFFISRRNGLMSYNINVKGSVRSNKKGPRNKINYLLCQIWITSTNINREI